MTTESTLNSSSLKVRRAEVDSICIYEITENELATLEHGSPSSIYLNFSLFLLSSAISFLVSVILTDITSIKVFTSFIVLITIGFIIGIILLVLWYKENSSSADVVNKIKGRLKEEGAPKVEGDDSIQVKI